MTEVVEDTVEAAKAGAEGAKKGATMNKEKPTGASW